MFRLPLGKFVLFLLFISVYFSGELVRFLAVDNTNHVSLLVNSESVGVGIGSIIFIVFFITILEFKYRNRPGKFSRVLLPLG